MSAKRRRTVARSLAVLTFAATVFVATSPDDASASIGLAPVADAYVTSASPNSNYGKSQSLRIDTAPATVRSYVQFDLGGAGNAVVKATLRVYAGSSSNSGFQVGAVAASSWTESTITYANSPAVGAALAWSGTMKSSTWVAVDVTALVKNQQMVTFSITGIGTTAIRLLSRESGSTAPQLEIELTGAPASTATVASTTPTAVATTTPTAVATTTTAAATATTVATPPPTSAAPSGGTTRAQPSFPMRGAFYYPWFPEAWKQGGVYPYTNYEPSLGYYNGGDMQVVRQHIAAMQYGNIEMGISSWWGQGHQTDNKFPTLLRAADGTAFRWSLYYEAEGSVDPTITQISSDLTYLNTKYGSDPSALRIDGRLVVFVYADALDSCGMVDRWKTANTVGVYVVLKVFGGYRDCVNQPDGWHQYGPASAASQQDLYSYSISPGFSLYGEAVRLGRDLARWNQNIRDMVASGARFQLVTTFNEWGEGTPVESATQWATPSGYGAFLDALHENGQAPAGDISTTTSSVVTNTTAAPVTTTTFPTTTTPPVGSDPHIAVVGDIACDPASGSFNGGYGSSSGSCRHKAVADLVVNGGYTAFLPLGDTQYENGTYDSFMRSYDLWFAPVKSISRPAVGNHEYQTAGASGYYQYFGASAGDPTKGYYSYDVGAWHIVALNSNCGVVSCSKGSAQEQWLRQDLAASAAQCSIVYWHHPLYSSGEHGNNPGLAALYQAAYDYRVELVLSGHDHHYERFAPQNASGVADPVGVRQFVVGTGGKNHYAIGTMKPNSEVTSVDTYGVLDLTLHSGSYDWRFIPEAGKTFTDAGTATCH